MSQSPAAAPTPVHAPLLIMGSPRSGTTFLAHMVNRFLDVHICRDNGTLLRFHRMLGHYEPLADERNMRRLIHHLYADHFFKTRLRDRGLTLSEDELFDRLTDRTYGGLIAAVFSATAASRGKSGWGYKRASFARVKGDQIDDLFPSAQFVHIIRDARDVVLSMRTSTDLLLERSWHFGAKDWVSHVETGRRIGQQLGPARYMEVRYEHFMAEPAQVLADVLAFIGAPDAEARIDRIRAEIGSQVKRDNTEKWRRAVPTPAIKVIERVAGGLLSDLGYPVVNPEVVGQPVGAAELAWLRAQRLAGNLFRTKIGVMAKYRLAVLKAQAKARFARNG